MADPVLVEAIDEFLLELRVERGLAPLTVSAYRRDLAQFADGADSSWRDDPAPAMAFAARLRRQGRRATTQARKLAAVRAFYGFALREGVARRNVADLLDLPRKGQFLPDVLSPEDVAAILEAPPEHDPVGIRDRAILEVLYACGLRVSELTGLDTDLPHCRADVLSQGAAHIGTSACPRTGALAGRESVRR
jgi:site-specific recombinase XerD